MSQSPSDDVTVLLERVNEGAAGAQDRLMELVYDQLRGIAQRHMAREFGRQNPGVTLQPTALVNETWLRLIKQRQKYDNSGQFFAIATKVLVRVLMDYHRSRKAAKRGGSFIRIPLDAERHAPAEEEDTELPDLISALDKLEKLDSRKAEVVKLRVLWGLSIPEIAESLGVGKATVDRDWSFAKAWLRKEITESQS